MSQWRSAKAKRVLAALLRIGWRIKCEIASSHKILERDGWENYTFAFHDSNEVDPSMLARVAKK